MPLTDALLLDPYPFHKWVARRTDGQAGTGTHADPLSANTPERFSQLMNSFRPMTVVHLGPGTFFSRGYSDAAAAGYGWQLKDRIRIVGSGIDVTTLQLVLNSNADAHFYAIGHPLSVGGIANRVDMASVSDLTIDANCSGQTGTTSARCGAIRLMGNEVRVQRVKVVNWGTMSGVSSKTSFAVALLTADPLSSPYGVNDVGIENCSALGPTTSGPAVAFHIGPKETNDTTLPAIEGYGKGPFIRNCFVDFATSDPPVIDTSHENRAFSMAWCLGGVIESCQAYNVKYGAMFLQTGSVRDFAVRNCFFKNVYKALYFKPALAQLGLTDSASITRSGSLATLTLDADYGLAIGDRLRVVGPTEHGYDGIHELTDVSGATVKFNTSSSLTSPVTVTASKVYGAGKVMLEGHEIELAPETSDELIGFHFEDGGLARDPVYPAFAHAEAVIRDNRLRYLDGKFDSSFAGYGLQVAGMRNLVVRDQVLELAPKNPLRNSRCGSATYFNNKSPDGKLIRGVNADNNNKKYDELETEAEDAFVLAYMNAW